MSSSVKTEKKSPGTNSGTRQKSDKTGRRGNYENTRQAPAKKTLSLKLKIIMWSAGAAALLILILAVSCTSAQGTIRYGICKTFLELHIDYPLTMRISEVREQQDYARIHFTHLDSFGQYRSSRIECYFEEDRNSAVRLWIQEVLARSNTPENLQAGQVLTVERLAGAAGIRSEILKSFLAGDIQSLPDSGDVGRLVSVIGQSPPPPMLVLSNVSFNQLPVETNKIEAFNTSIPILLSKPLDLTLPPRYPSNLADLYQLD